jgi:hypothetical protein
MLAMQVGAEDAGGAPVEGDGAIAGRRFGRALDDAVADRGALTADGELAAVEVDVVPAQPGGFAAA